ncbi:MAG: cobalamin-binding protein [Magnetococcales bacterium]|nr:cobalamin-binding protein [Magnetococcales bacterium]
MRVVLALLSGLAAAQAEEITVHDDTGRQVTLSAPARRIVSLAPHLTELLYAAGAGGSMVGAVDYSDYPPEAARLPRVGSHGRFDLERLLALRPDLVVGWSSGNAGLNEGLARRHDMALYISEPRHLEDIATTLQRLGRLTGNADSGRQAGEAFLRNLEVLRRSHADKRPVSLFYQMWDMPLMTLGGGHMVGDVIRLCGGRNIFEGLPQLAPPVDREAVLAADPEVIVTSGVEGERPVWLEAWRKWPWLKAVKRERFLIIHPDLLQRQTPRIQEGARLLCAFLEQVRQQE